MRDEGAIKILNRTLCLITGCLSMTNKNRNGQEKCEWNFDDLMKLAVNQGFFYPSCEIYGSKGGFYDYGHLGTLIKRKWETLWRSYFLSLHHNFWEIDGATVMPKGVFVGSGHLENFVDPLVVCKRCGARHRADHLVETELGIENAEDLTLEEMNELIIEHQLKCPKCGGELSVAQWFNLMFDVTVGSSMGDLKGMLRDLKKIDDKEKVLQIIDKIKQVMKDVDENTMYLRPETAQSPYMCFEREFESLRNKLPLGLAVIGRAYRNEISPRQALFRLREFSQAELQVFFDPDEIDNEPRYEDVKDMMINVKRVTDKDTERYRLAELGLPKMYAFYLSRVYDFLINTIGLPEDRVRIRELSDKEKAFYNILHWDVEFFFRSFGMFREIAGIHYRGDHDLKGHSKASGHELTALRKDETRFYPHVIELSFGIDRNVFAILDAAYSIDYAPTAKGGVEKRVVLRMSKQMAPVQVAVFPLLSNREQLVKKAREVYDMISKQYRAFYDESGAIGRRYRRQDQIGTPYCITIDFDTLEDDTVTVRDRDSMKQVRVKVNDLVTYLSNQGLKRM